MKSIHKHLFAAGLLATLGFSALAQTPPPAGDPAPQSRQERMHRHDPAKMQERMAQRQAELKAKLQITSAQEGAWSTFTSALKPPADRPARAEFAQLTTPERIDRMQALKARRDAEMAKRADATKTFYATLTPEQQKVFDTETLRFLGRHMYRHHGGPGHRG